MASRYRTLIVLGIAQCFGQTAAPMIVLLGGIVGARLAPDLSWATLPLAVMVLGDRPYDRACDAANGPLWAQGGFSGLRQVILRPPRFGGRPLLFTRGISPCFVLRLFLLEATLPLFNSSGLRVAESVPADQIAKCLSLLMLAGIVAAFVGPAGCQWFQSSCGLTAVCGLVSGG